MRLIGVLDGMRLGESRIPLYSLLFFCRAVGGELRLHPLEVTDAGWFDRDALPSPTIGAERWAGPVFAAIDGERATSTTTTCAVRSGGVNSERQRREGRGREGPMVAGAQRLLPQLSSSRPRSRSSDVEAIVALGRGGAASSRVTKGDVVGTLTLIIFAIPTGSTRVDRGRRRRRGRAANGRRRATHPRRDRRGATARCDTIDLTSRPSREAANALYRKLGFDTARDQCLQVFGRTLITLSVCSLLILVVTHL